jgi:hypothetical protein
LWENEQNHEYLKQATSAKFGGMNEFAAFFHA